MSSNTLSRQLQSPLALTQTLRHPHGQPTRRPWLSPPSERGGRAVGSPCDSIPSSSARLDGTVQARQEGCYQRCVYPLPASFSDEERSLTRSRPHLPLDPLSSTAYLAGQKQAFQEVLEFVQAGLDHPQASSSSSGFQGQATAAGSLDVARLINFVCVRSLSRFTAPLDANQKDSNRLDKRRSRRRMKTSTTTNPPLLPTPFLPLPAALPPPHPLLPLLSVRACSREPPPLLPPQLPTLRHLVPSPPPLLRPPPTSFATLRHTLPPPLHLPNPPPRSPPSSADPPARF